jgi:hypothetical protein
MPAVYCVRRDARHLAQYEPFGSLASLAYGNGLTLKPILAYELTLAHPIFFKSREPFVAPVKPAAPSAAMSASPPAPVFVDPGLILGGILMNGGLNKVYLSRKTDPGGAWVMQGESFVGWKVRSIESGRTKLEKDGHVIDLWLYPE